MKVITITWEYDSEGRLVKKEIPVYKQPTPSPWDTWQPAPWPPEITC